MRFIFRLVRVWRCCFLPCSFSCHPRSRRLFGGRAILLAIFLLISAIEDHSTLATFRQRRFALKPDPTKTVEELLSALVNAWCARAAVTPLQLVLSELSEDGKNIKEAASARDALLSVAKLPDTEVSPSEKCILCLAIAALSERVRPKAAG